VTEYIISEAKKNAVVNIVPIAAVTLGQKGEELTEMADLKDAGAAAFSDDGEPVANSQIMRRALEYSNLLDAIIIDHCEDKDLSGQGVMHEGYHSLLYGIPGIPSSSEETMVARDIILAEKAQSRVHLAHISTKGSVELIKDAKRKKIKVSAEVTPHHLLLTDEALKNYDPNLKVSPPLRSVEDTEALIAAVKDGTIDVFATDHAPHTPDEKAVELDYAPFGIIGLESAVPLLLNQFVNKNIISLEQFIRMISTKPAEILGLEDKGKIRIGADADLTILNLHQETVIDKTKFKSKSRNCPFHGWKCRGLAVMTIVGGRIVHHAH
jgi:dihydroorotase